MTRSSLSDSKSCRWISCGDSLGRLTRSISGKEPPSTCISARSRPPYESRPRLQISGETIPGKPGPVCSPAAILAIRSSPAMPQVSCSSVGERTRSPPTSQGNGSGFRRTNSHRTKPTGVPLDVDSGKPVRLHRGSVNWNAYRQKWIMIAGEQGGTSLLGEIWYAEAPAPDRALAPRKKIVTHDQYSFYNPVQHAFFDQDGGRVIYFEGTYTTSFSGNPRRRRAVRLQPDHVSTGTRRSPPQASSRLDSSAVVGRSPDRPRIGGRVRRPDHNAINFIGRHIMRMHSQSCCWRLSKMAACLILAIAWSGCLSAAARAATPAGLASLPLPGGGDGSVANTDGHATTDLTACFPRVRDYSLMWWADGFQGRSSTGQWNRAIQTGQYAFVLDVERMAVTHVGSLGESLSYADAARARGMRPGANCLRPSWTWKSVLAGLPIVARGADRPWITTVRASSNPDASCSELM